MTISQAEEIMINEITHSLSVFFKTRIKPILAVTPNCEESYNAQFNNFITRMHKKKGKIYNAVTQNTCKEITVVGNPPDFKFIWTLRESGDSLFEVHYIKKYSQLFNEGYIKSKLKPTYGYVYVLKSEYGYKVGCSSNLSNRLKHFGVLLPFKYTVDSIVKCSDFKDTEKLIHDLFAKKRLNGEWFDLTDSDFEELDLILSNVNLKREPFDIDKLIANKVLGGVGNANNL